VGELRDLAERVRPWLKEVARPTVVVAHGGVGRVLWIELVGLDPARAVSMAIPARPRLHLSEALRGN